MALRPWLLAGSAALIGFFMLQRPDAPPQAGQASDTRAADELGRQYTLMERAKGAVRERLRDPDSADFRAVRFHRGKDDIPLVCGEVNAANGFGGKTGFQAFISTGTADMTYLQSEVRDFHALWNRLCT